MKIANNEIDRYVKNIANEKIAGALVFGKDISVIRSRFNAISKAIVSDLKDQFLVVNLSKERLSKDPACLADEFYSFSMFGGRKLVIIRDSDVAANTALKALLKDGEGVKKSDNFIIIQSGDLDAGNALRKLAQASDFIAALPCYEDNDGTTRKLIEQQLKRNGIDFSYDLVSQIFTAVGKNRQIIANEIEKLALYLGEEKLTGEVVDKVIKSQNETVFEEFSNNFASKKFAQAVKNIDNLLENGFEPVMATRFLSNYVQKLYFAKSAIVSKGLSIEVAAKEQRLFFKAEANFKSQLRNLDLKQISLWLLEIEKLEIKLKSGVQSSVKSLFLSFLMGCLEK